MIMTTRNNRQGSKFWMQTYPCTSKKFIENIILFTVSIQESRANGMHSEIWIQFRKSPSTHFKLFKFLKFRKWNLTVRLCIIKWTTISFWLSITPNKGRWYNNKNLFFWMITLFQSIDNSLCLIHINLQLRYIKNYIICLSYLFSKRLWFWGIIDYFNSIWWWRSNHSCKSRCVQCS